MTLTTYHHSETGCVFTQDNDGHWFFIPADKVELFNELKSEMLDDEDAEIEFITDFENYRLSGGPERIVVHSWHYRDEK